MCPESDVIDEVRSLRGMPDELLANPEFMELVLPSLRADFHLCGSYEYRKRPPLDCRMLVIAGTDDEEVGTDPQKLMAWSDETSGPLELREIPAGHFFINTHRNEVINIMIDSLMRTSGSRGPSGNSKERFYA
jgi:surfactin synthase thioesterase subunit